MQHSSIISLGVSKIGYLYIVLFAFTAWAQEQPDQAAIRAQLLDRIDATQQQIEHNILASNKEEQALRDIESKQVRLSESLSVIAKQLEANSKRLMLLETAYTTQQQKAERLQRQLVDIMRAHYQQKNFSPLRIVLETNNERHWNRHLAYLRYLTAAQWKLHQQAQEVKRTLSESLMEMRQVQKSTAEQQQQQQQQLDNLRQLELQRREALVGLQQVLEGSREQLARYQAVAERLRQVVESIGELKLDEATSFQPFAAQRGLLPSPVLQATIEKDQQLKALRFVATQGEPVRAVASGQVVYANWLSGLGLVLILDHGDEYLSLYAHNQRLAVAVGDWVKPLEEIAYIGTSGGQQTAMLLLQLFHKGTKLDPSAWLTL